MKLSKGYQINNTSQIKECFAIEGDNILINVGADNYLEIMKSMSLLIPEPCFFILEVPCSKEKEAELNKGKEDTLHNDVYYLDNIDHEFMLSILNDLGDILINDGISSFGFSSLKDQVEIMKCKYNLISIYSKIRDPFIQKLKELGIEEVDNIITAGDLISKNNPGICKRYVSPKGKNVFDIVKTLSKVGMYLDHVEWFSLKH